MIIVVSDVHLGYEHADHESFLDFIVKKVATNNDISAIVLNGDILDLWRTDPLRIMIKFRKVLDEITKLPSKIDVCYVVGNHDYHLLELKDLICEEWKIEVVENKIIEDGGVSYYFEHGHDLEWGILSGVYKKFADILCLSDDDIGGNADKLWKFFTSVDAVKKVSSFFSRVLSFRRQKGKEIKEALTEPRERFDENKLKKFQKKAFDKAQTESDKKNKPVTVIYGHSHVAHETHTRDNLKIANAGCWVDEPPKNKILPLKHKNSYLKITGAKIELCDYTP